ncbi:MAG: hypothetical protein JSS66_19075 [Armatimonadetes bacterium]|nr:hypothetical protein [Armatimonadota bacterium]
MSSYKVSESRRVSAIAEASELLHELAPTGRVKDRLRNIMTVWPRWSWTKTRDVYYRDARYAVSDEELADLRLLVAARKEHRGLIERIERLEAALRIQDADFHSAQIGALEQARGAVDRAMAGDVE